MTTLTVTSKGQVTFKQSLLEHIGVKPGQKLEAELLSGGRVIVKAQQQLGDISSFIGCLSKSTNIKLSIDEITSMTEQGWSDKE